MTFSHNESDENDMSPRIDEDENNDDDEPPAGGVAIASEETEGISPSMAPSAEPNHRANPQQAVTA